MKNKLQTKLLLYISGIIILVFILMSVLLIKKNKLETDAKSKEYVQILSERYSQEVIANLESYFTSIEITSKNITNIVTDFRSDAIKLSKKQLYSINFKKHFLINTWVLLSDVEENDKSNWTLLNIDVRGSMTKSNKVNISRIDNLLSHYAKGNSVTVSEPYQRFNKTLIDAYAPVFNSVNQIGFVGVTIDLEQLSEYMLTAMKVSEYAVLNVIDKNSGVIIFSDNDNVIGKPYLEAFADRDNNSIEQGFKSGFDFSTEITYNKDEYYSYYTLATVVQNNPWYVELSIPKHTLMSQLSKDIEEYNILILISLSILILLFYFLIRRIIGPIKIIKDTLSILVKGDLQSVSKIEIKTNDELEEVGESVNELILGLQKMAKFTTDIEKGNLDNGFEVLSENDQLGKALIALQDSIKANIEADKERKQKEEQTVWATQGIAKFSDILRQDNTDIKKMGFNVISNLVSYLNINQGAMFVLNDENPSEPYFELVSTVAYGREKIIKKEVQLGEGLVGRCAYEKKTIFMVEVPEDYVAISSGLGDARPNCVLIVPCILDNVVYGVIEVAAFTALKPYEVKFVEMLGESIGSTIASVRINERTTKLLVDSQRKSEELASQEEELRQNLEEMETTQEDLKRQMDENSKMREDLLEQNALLDSLLDTIPDYIYFKDRDCKFIKISKSMLSIFGAKSVDEVIGKSDFDYHTPENAQKFYDGEQKIMKTREGLINQLEREIKVDGSVIWNNITKLPLLTSDAECIGTFGISKDVTDIKLLEEETKKQKIELSGIIDAIKRSTYIVEYDTDGNILDINDALLDLLKLSKDNLVGLSNRKELVGNDISEDYYKEFWQDLQNGKIKELKSKYIVDNNEIYLYEKYTPVLDNDNNVIKVIKVAFDITQYK